MRTCTLHTPGSFTSPMTPPQEHPRLAPRPVSRSSSRARTPRNGGWDNSTKPNPAAQKPPQPSPYEPKPTSGVSVRSQRSASPAPSQARERSQAPSGGGGDDLSGALEEINVLRRGIAVHDGGMRSCQKASTAQHAGAADRQVVTSIRLRLNLAEFLDILCGFLLSLLSCYCPV